MKFIQSPHHHSPVQKLSRAFVATGVIGFLITSVQAIELHASDGVAGDRFGEDTSQSGNIALIGATDATIGSTPYQGTAYVFRNLDGSAIQAAKLIASDGSAESNFGRSDISGTIGIVGANHANNDHGAAYIFRNLDTVTGTVTEQAKLVASDANGAGMFGNSGFGNSVSIAGTIGIVGAFGYQVGSNDDQGAAYVYRNLDTITGTVTESARLVASDGQRVDYLGYPTAISGTIAIIGADQAKVSGNLYQGAAYVFRNLDSATGTVSENVKLVASNGAAGHNFGAGIGISGTIAVVGASHSDQWPSPTPGEAYVFRNLDTATGTVTEQAKLIASDGALDNYFGESVAISGTTAMLGSLGTTVGNNADQGAAYIYRHLDTVTGTSGEDVKLTVSHGIAGEYFGGSISLQGDRFLISATHGTGATADSGKVYMGNVSSFTTLDAGNANGTTDGLSFVSQKGWVIGQTTSANTLTLLAGDSATVNVTGHFVTIGQNAGSNGNLLDVAGNLTANEVRIGNLSGNFGNALRLEATATLSASALVLGQGNSLQLQGLYTDGTSLLTYLGATQLQVSPDGSVLQVVDSSNYSNLISRSYDGFYTTFTAIPEPSALLLFLFGGVVAFRRRV